MNFSLSRRAEPVVDVTPLIDIIFQLVLFFMVSTTFVTTSGFEVDLPRSSSQNVIRERDEAKLWITAEGSIFLDEQPMDWPGLVRALGTIAKQSPATLVIIKADKNVDHGRVVAVMDLARSHGLHQLAIATEVPQEGAGGDPTP